jgi:beta-fructofuranosidase
MWMNDPNGPIYWKGRYHMFYQYAPVISNSATKYWGHAVSTDLVHWKNLGIALAPTPNGPDKDGCWSGSAVVHNGVPTLIYTGATWSAENERAERSTGRVPERQMVAVAANPNDLKLLKWTKLSENPVLAAPPADLKVTGWRDPALWKEGNLWFMLIGSGETGKQGMALLYSSSDLRHWTYMHPFAVAKSDPSAPATAFGPMWECPDFFLINGKPFLLVARGNTYLTGTYANHKFAQASGGQIDYGSAAYAQKTMEDGQGRRIWWGWIREKRSMKAQVDAGWAGVMSLPKLLGLQNDGMLSVEPVPELNLLRASATDVPPQKISSDGPLLLNGVAGDCVEIEAEFELGDSQQCGLRIRSTTDGTEQTLVGYDRTFEVLFSDTTNSSKDPEISSAASPRASSGKTQGALTLNSGPLRLRVYVDASVLEIFANGKASISDRVYPSEPASLGIGIFSRGGTAHLRSMRVWKLRPISSDRLTSEADLFRV